MCVCDVNEIAACNTCTCTLTCTTVSNNLHSLTPISKLSSPLHSTFELELTIKQYFPRMLKGADGWVGWAGGRKEPQRRSFLKQRKTFLQS